jgi:hypothetical protein
MKRPRHFDLQTLTFFAFIALVFGCIAALVALDWMAYFERFPDAPWWTFFFQ